MNKLLIIAIVLLGFISCDSKIENGDLVYLTLRKENNLALRSDGGFQCSDENITPLIFIEKENGFFELKTEEGLNVVIKDYYLYALNEKPTNFRLVSIEDKTYVEGPYRRYLGCNGKEVYQTNKPHVSILKY